MDFELDPVKKEIILPRIEYDFAKFDLRKIQTRLRQASYNT